MSTAEHLDAALEHLRAIGHGHTADDLTRRHVEFASAHIREAWIANDGQNATPPDLTHKAVASFFRLQDKLSQRPETYVRNGILVTKSAPFTSEAVRAEGETP